MHVAPQLSSALVFIRAWETNPGKRGKRACMTHGAFAMPFRLGPLATLNCADVMHRPFLSHSSPIRARERAFVLIPCF